MREQPDQPSNWIKADLHLHCAEDPADELDYSAMDLLFRAHELGFKVLAISLHDHVLTRPELFAAAKALGILLIPAAELRLEGADVVVLNLTEIEATELRTFAGLEALRRARGDSILVFAPHPFYVFGGSIGRRLERHIDCFDAVEYCHFHTRGLNLNPAAVRLAEKHGKPLLATSDAHRLDFFGDHYSLLAVGNEPTPESVFAAIRAGRIKCTSPAWPWRRFLEYVSFITIRHPIEVMLRRFEE